MDKRTFRTKLRRLVGDDIQQAASILRVGNTTLNGWLREGGPVPHPVARGGVINDLTAAMETNSLTDLVTWLIDDGMLQEDPDGRWQLYAAGNYGEEPIRIPSRFSDALKELNP